MEWRNRCVWVPWCEHRRLNRSFSACVESGERANSSSAKRLNPHRVKPEYWERVVVRLGLICQPQSRAVVEQSTHPSEAAHQRYSLWLIPPLLPCDPIHCQTEGPRTSDIPTPNPNLASTRHVRTNRYGHTITHIIVECDKRPSN